MIFKDKQAVTTEDQQWLVRKDEQVDVPLRSLVNWRPGTGYEYSATV